MTNMVIDLVMSFWVSHHDTRKWLKSSWRLGTKDTAVSSLNHYASQVYNLFVDGDFVCDMW